MGHLNLQGLNQVLKWLISSSTGPGFGGIVRSRVPETVCGARRARE